MNFLTGKIVQALCWTLLHSLWQGLLLAVITGIIMVLSKKSGSALRYKLLSTIFFAFIVIAGITFYHEMQAIKPAGTSAATIKITAPVNHVNTAPVQANNIVPVADSNGKTLQYYVQNFVDYFNRQASLIVAVWFIIFMARCVKILSGLVHLQRIRHYKTSPVPLFWEERIKLLAKRLNIKKTVLLLESALIKVPAVVGVLKPTILIPIGLLNKLSQEEVESILMHELAHIRRKDYFFNLLQCFVDVIFFFNPAVLWISSLIRNERENCCDDIAINETKDKKQFIQALVSFHQYNTSVSKYAMPFAARKSKLVDRVKRIVNNNNSTLNPAEKVVLVGCLIAFGVAFITVSNGQTDNTKKKQPQSKTAAATTQKNTQQSTKDTQKAAGTAKNKMPVKTFNTNDSDSDGYDINYQALGYKNITVDKLIELREHGVSATFIRQLNEAGYKNIPLDEAIALRDHGIDIDFVHELNNAGFKDVSLEKITEARDHGVDGSFINQLNEAGFRNITLDKAIELRDHGVSLAFIKQMNDLGFKGVTLEKAVELADHGVNSEFVNEFRQAGYTNLSLDDYIQLKDHGVNVAYIKELKNEGAGNISIEKAIQYKDEGVTGNYLSSLRQAGYSDITIDKALEARNHGVTADYISSFKKFGFNNLSLDKVMELQDHGVTAAFIDKIKTKTGSYFSPDEYIRLKDVGFSDK
ncbi:MAG TPA: M56 family metallopeptidase [Chitinophagaceae bacterium]|nr:M56 family metallopeptidase [Chitinophagaceae bacterium]